MTRLANKHDIHQIINLMYEFRDEIPSSYIGKFENEEAARTLINEILAGKGQIVVAYDDDRLVGMCIGIVGGTTWDPDNLILHEIAFYVTQSHRKQKIGSQILQEYLRQAELMLKNDRIVAYTMTQLAISPDLKLNNLGFTKMEEVYIKGAA